VQDLFEHGRMVAENNSLDFLRSNQLFVKFITLL
jgi:hypothetical protein